MSQALSENLNLHSKVEQAQISPSYQLPSEWSLSKYIRPFPHATSVEDIQFLYKKGAFTVPDTGLCYELLRNYAQFVQPYLPILDLEDFLESIVRDDGLNQISLMVYQAVLFAGSSFVDAKLLQAEGYHSRKAARKDFFHRARVRSVLQRRIGVSD